LPAGWPRGGRGPPPAARRHARGRRRPRTRPARSATRARATRRGAGRVRAAAGGWRRGARGRGWDRSSARGQTAAPDAVTHPAQWGTVYRGAPPGPAGGAIPALLTTRWRERGPRRTWAWPRPAAGGCG